MPVSRKPNGNRGHTPTDLAEEIAAMRVHEVEQCSGRNEVEDTSKVLVEEDVSNDNVEVERSPVRTPDVVASPVHVHPTGLMFY